MTALFPKPAVKLFEAVQIVSLRFCKWAVLSVPGERSARLGHTAVTQRGWDTMELGYYRTVTQWDWDTTEL